MADRSPTLAEVIRDAVARRDADLRVALPGKVVRYDAAKQQADVKPLLRDFYRDAEDNKVSVSLPVISNVPVVFPGAGEWGLTFPVEAGSTVLLMFADRSLDNWLPTGSEVDPVDEHRHHLSDAIAIVGLRDFGHAWAGASASKAVLGKASGPQINIDGSEVTINAGLEIVVGASSITLNGGVLGVARQTDPVQAGPFGGTITGPCSLTVKAG